MPYQDDRCWADRYTPQILEILNQHIAQLAVISLASDEQDKNHATDYILRLEGGTIAARLRRPYYHFRDLTIRSRRANGIKTELAKIKEGYAYRYLYGWTVENVITEWLLVDLDKVRSVGLLEKRWPEKENKDRNGKPDGTAFISIPWIDLELAGCLLGRVIQKIDPFSMQRLKKHWNDLRSREDAS